MTPGLDVTMKGRKVGLLKHPYLVPMIGVRVLQLIAQVKEWA